MSAAKKKKQELKNKAGNLKNKVKDKVKTKLQTVLKHAAKGKKEQAPSADQPSAEQLLWKGKEVQITSEAAGSMVFGRFGKVSEVKGSEAKLLLGESLQVHSCDLSYLTLVSDLKPFTKFKSMVSLNRLTKQDILLKSNILKRSAEESEERGIFLDHLEVVAEKQEAVLQRHLNMAYEFLKFALPLDYKLFRFVDPVFSGQHDFALLQVHRADSPEEKARRADILISRWSSISRISIARRQRSSVCPSTALSPVITGLFWCLSLETLKLLRPAGTMIL